MKKRNIFLIGPMGVGKTSIGYILSKKLNMTFLDSDEELKKFFKKTIAQIFELYTEKIFRKYEETMIATLTKKKNIVLSTGGGAVKSKKTRNNLLKNGFVVYLKYRTLFEQEKRLKNDRERPLILKNKIKEILRKLSIERTPLYEEISNFSTCVEKKNTQQIVQEISFSFFKFIHEKK